LKAEKVIIVGAGLAGLACANQLVQAGLEPSIIEASDAAGGRVRTDQVDGFLLDRGFQVFLTAYPTARRLLDLEALDLHRFKPGALVFKDGALRRVMDVFRCPQHALSSAMAPIGSLRDKLLVAKLRLHAMQSSLEEIATHPDIPTELLSLVLRRHFSGTRTSDIEPHVRVHVQDVHRRVRRPPGPRHAGDSESVGSAPPGRHDSAEHPGAIR
jgi:phytoene dehydrogenase-like protein